MSTLARTCVILAGILGAGAAVSPSVAASAPAPCPGVGVDVARAVRVRWPDLPRIIDAALAGRVDVDACARIAVRADRATVILQVTLPDGRTTARAVGRSDDVVPTLQALLLLPGIETPAPESTAAAPQVQATPPAPSPAPIVEAPKPASRTTTTIVAAVATPAEPQPREPLHLEFSLGAGMRAGDGQAGVSLGAQTAFDLAGWLLGLGAGFARYGVVSGSGPAAPLLEGAVLGGRRFRFEHVTLDLTAGAALALRGAGSRTVAVPVGTTPDEVPEVDDGPWTRLVAGVRVNFRPRSLARPFIGLDGDLGVAASPANLPASEWSPPRWVVGLVAGAAVGSP